MIVKDVYYSLKTETMDLIASQSGNIPVAKVVVARTYEVNLKMIFNDQEVAGLGDLRNLPDRIMKALAKPEIAATILDEVKRSRAYGDESS